MHDIQPTPPSALRRDRKAQAAPGLVAAPPVRSARVVGAGAAGVRGWLLGGGIAVAIIVAFSATMLTTGLGAAEPPALSEAQNLRASDRLEASCALPAVGEASGAVGHVDACDETEEVGDFLDDVADSPKSDLAPAPQASGQPHPPDDARSGPIAPNVPAQGTSTQPTPNSPAPNDPSPGPVPAPIPAPGGPSPGDPAPSNPAPTNPAPSNPAPEPAPGVHVPKSLAFTNLTEHRAVGILGLGLISSHTLSISGEPGSTATVWYDGRNEGSVRFNSNGRASITIGKSLLSTGPGSKIIRAAYSDGTSGSEIQARADSI